MILTFQVLFFLQKYNLTQTKNLEYLMEVLCVAVNVDKDSEFT